ncbi:amiloride-sensitive sodium channel subunit alpha-like [Pecten maximus]|uniref:amiloride-sensitive sodium channel subunit alpha-like n=1 Tax=Pecten maximus TaxID=6579 RepID=UPI001458880F|nr:amiloride-sensitive sodium channel subunit alpha-like [Pecten maximus]
MAPGARDTLRNFMSYTSIHGLGRLSESRFWIQKAFWFCMCLASFIVCFYQISELSAQYKNIPLNTKVRIVHENQMFPTVTFCDLNPLLYSEVKKWSHLFEIIEQLSYYWNISLTEFQKPGGVDSPIPNYTYSSTLNIGAFRDPHEAGRTLFSLRMIDLSDDQLLQMSSYFDELVLDCKFHGNSCSME